MIDTYNTLSNPDLTLQDMTSFGGNGVNRPATGISWNEAARFVNFLNTSKGFSEAYKFTTGGFNDNIALWTNLDTGFDAANPFRNSNAHYFLPSGDEWYKGGVLRSEWRRLLGLRDRQRYGPHCGGGRNDEGTAVYSGQVGPADITNAGGLSAYGTMAQSGNVFEWA